MRTRTLRRAALLGVAVTSLVVSADAYALPRPIVRSICSPTPSLTQCQTASYLNACHLQHECDAVVHAAAASGARGSTRMVLTTNAGAAPKSPVLRKNGTVTQNGIASGYDLTGLQSVVATSGIEGLDLSLWLAAQKSKVAEAAAISTMHPAWEADGQRVSSCGEYVFQKLYDYTRFNETAKALGDDAWAIIDVAYMAGTPGISDRTLYEFQTGKPIVGAPAVLPPGRPRKNQFFQNDAHVFDDVATYRSGLLSADLATFLASAAFKTGQAPVFGWARNAQQAAAHRPNGVPLFSLADYAALALRRRHYGSLVYAVWQGARAMADALIAYELAANGPTKYCTKPMNGQKSACAIVKPDGTLNGILDPILALKAPYASTADADDSWVAGFATSYPDADTVRDEVLALEAIEPLDSNCVDGDANACVRDASYASGHAARIRAEYLLAEYLNVEWSLPNHGCFDTTSSYCDWSPKDFVATIVDRMSWMSGQLYHQCIANTGDDFVALANQDPADPNGRRKQDHWFPPFSIAKNQLVHYQRDYTPTTDLVDLFVARFKDRDALWKAYAADEAALVAQVADLPFNAGGTALSDASSDSNSLGDTSTFGASYGYSLGWNVWQTQAATNTAGESVICRLAGNANASLYASVSAFGTTVSLADAALESLESDGDSHVNAHFTVLGTQVFTPQAIAPNDPLATFNAIVPVASHPLGPPVPIADQWFVLLGVVPVHLQAQIALSAGATLTASGSNPAGCDIANVPFTMQTGFTPFVRADLVASAAFDVLLADAGVRVTLNLLTVSVPLDFRFVATPANGVTTVAYANSLGVSLDELSGSVELFADLHTFWDTYSASKTVFSWGGFHQNQTLWSKKKSFPLDSLSLRLYGGAYNAPSGGAQ